jgi:pyruvate formate lyase activating enzyme
VSGRARSTGRAGWCFDVQRYSIHDGPGIRTTVFLKGCPLACPWCHNPEGRSRGQELRIIAGRCIHCMSCLAACPLGLADGPVAPDPTRCLRCGRCAEVCPTGTRQLVGYPLTVGRVVELVERDRPFYDESGGGVTFSGGEPFAQPRFLLACLEAMRTRAIHTVVDTCGVAPRATLLKAAALTDLFLYDLKILDPDRHLGLIGAPLGPILDNLRALDRVGADLARMPFIPGYNDDPRTSRRSAPSWLDSE